MWYLDQISEQDQERVLRLSIQLDKGKYDYPCQSARAFGLLVIASELCVSKESLMLAARQVVRTYQNRTVAQVAVLILAIGVSFMPYVSNFRKTQTPSTMLMIQGDEANELVTDDAGITTSRPISSIATPDGGRIYFHPKDRWNTDLYDKTGFNDISPNTTYSNR